MRGTLFLILLLLGTREKSQAQSWTMQNGHVAAPGVSVADISASSATNAWAIATTLFSGNFGAVPIFLRTTNGGQTWAPAFLPLDTSHTPSSIFALNQSIAWVTAYDMANENAGKVYKTVDGGASWTEQSTAAFTDAARYIHFFNANEGVAVGDSSVYLSSDGGLHWTFNGSLPIPFPGPSHFTFNANEAKGDTVWLADSYGNFYRSIDRGQNWTLLSGNLGTNVKGIAFKNANYGLAITATWTGSQTSGNYTDGGYIHRTNDGGATWTPTPYGLGSTNISTSAAKYDVAYLPGSQNTFVVSCEIEGFSCISLDGGMSWQFIDSNQKHTALAFTSEQNGWSGGYLSGFFEGIYKWDGLSAAVPTLVQTSVGIYPNPAGEWLNIVLPHSESALFSITDITGKQQMHGELDALHTKVRIGELLPGTYHVSGRSRAGTFSATFVKD